VIFSYIGICFYQNVNTAYREDVTRSFDHGSCYNQNVNTMKMLPEVWLCCVTTLRRCLARAGHYKIYNNNKGLNIFLTISLLHSEHFLDMKFATLVRSIVLLFGNDYYCILLIGISLLLDSKSSCYCWLESYRYPGVGLHIPVFSERELTFTFAICYRPSVCCLSSVCLSSVCRLSVTFVRPTQAVQIFGNISMALGT